MTGAVVVAALEPVLIELVVDAEWLAMALRSSLRTALLRASALVPEELVDEEGKLTAWGVAILVDWLKVPDAELCMMMKGAVTVLNIRADVWTAVCVVATTSEVVTAVSEDVESVVGGGGTLLVLVSETTMLVDVRRVVEVVSMDVTVETREVERRLVTVVLFSLVVVVEVGVGVDDEGVALEAADVTFVIATAVKESCEVEGAAVTTGPNAAQAVSWSPAS